MSRPDDVPIAVTHRVRDSCLCLHLQRAARALARRFDTALRPVGLTSGQFSLLMSLNRPEAPTIGQVSTLLAMDRTTLTANLKPLERRGLVSVGVDGRDRRARRMHLTPEGRQALAAAVPIWEAAHADAERLLAGTTADGLRRPARVVLIARGVCGNGSAFRPSTKACSLDSVEELALHWETPECQHALGRWILLRSAEQ